MSLTILGDFSKNLHVMCRYFFSCTEHFMDTFLLILIFPSGDKTLAKECLSAIAKLLNSNDAWLHEPNKIICIHCRKIQFYCNSLFHQLLVCNLVSKKETSFSLKLLLQYTESVLVYRGFFHHAKCSSTGIPKILGSSLNYASVAFAQRDLRQILFILSFSCILNHHTLFKIYFTKKSVSHNMKQSK